MTKYREILRLHEQGISRIDIASCCGCSRNTVSSVLRHAEEAGLSWGIVRDLSDERISQLLFGERSDQPGQRKQPDFEQIHRELAKSGVTISLLWHEYCGECRVSGDIPFMYTQFCKLYREYATVSKATMHIERKPGEKLEVDWAGQTLPVWDSVAGAEAKAYLFVATLPCSGYTYVEAFINQKLENWINAHINAYNFFGGVTRILVTDNLKTGVQNTSEGLATLNRTYQEMAEHYATCVIPARVRKPKDKAGVEKAVGIASTWIIAALRNQQFFSVSELNAAIREKLTEFNERPFQKRPGNRRDAFFEAFVSDINWRLLGDKEMPKPPSFGLHIRELTEADAAIYIGRSRSFLRACRREGKKGKRPRGPKYTRDSERSIRYPVEELDKWLSSRALYEVSCEEMRDEEQ